MSYRQLPFCDSNANLRFRRPLLFPVELNGKIFSNIYNNGNNGDRRDLHPHYSEPQSGAYLFLPRPQRAQKVSNLQPSESESDALPIELYAYKYPTGWIRTTDFLLIREVL